jgi:phasin family protein
MTNQYPFAFDAEKMKDMFKMPEFDKMFEQVKMPGFDVEAMISAQQKNMHAMIEANKVAMAGYQDLYKRQVALVEESLAQAKDQMSELQSQPMSAEQASKNMELMKSAVEKASNDVKELSEMAQKANTEAFNIIKGRFEEVVAEFKAGVEKVAV